MPSHESSMRNLAKARAKMRPPRPWRSTQESQMIRRFVFQWSTCRGTKPSGRTWARALGISHTWLQKLVRQFQADPSQMWRLQRANGDPKIHGTQPGAGVQSADERAWRVAVVAPGKNGGLS